jgi:hypothetical protein
MTVHGQQSPPGCARFEGLDTGNISILEDIFTDDCIFHRGDLIEPAQGVSGRSVQCLDNIACYVAIQKLFLRGFTLFQIACKNRLSAFRQICLC